MNTFVMNTFVILQNLFLVLLWTYFPQCLSVFINEFEQLNNGWED